MSPSKQLALLTISRGAEEAYDHLLHLVLYTHPAYYLDVLHPTEDLVLHLEARLHAESRALLDRKRVLVKVFQRAGLAQVDDDVRSALDLQT